MLENITNKITGIFQGLSNKGAITEKDLETTLREVRVALLEADVSLKVSKDLIKNIQEKALGQKVIENVHRKVQSNRCHRSAINRETISSQASSRHFHRNREGDRRFRKPSI